ncbi:hypothetical protein E2C01_026218 [Portunus trituberculatus]|uniref:Uncharacterized protein n=1 Tax=Portunus trituberculatus TaxID=210409 RepID=A0A5B7EHL2_PORTR|nr:hypothetical protein [Portunus trituberculatus]
MMVMVSTRGSDHDTRWKYAARRSNSSPHSPAAVIIIISLNEHPYLGSPSRRVPSERQVRSCRTPG